MYKQEKHVITNKVHQENQIRKVLNKVLPDIVKALKPFIGCKILKADEELVKKFTDKVDYLRDLRDKIKIVPLPGQTHAKLQCLYVTASRYSIRVQVSASFQISDHGCIYAEGTVYIGDIQNSLFSKAGDGNLQKINEYTSQKMLSAAGEFQKYESAYKAAEKAESSKDKMFYGLRDLLK